jgi:hypothetical protein
MDFQLDLEDTCKNTYTSNYRKLCACPYKSLKFVNQVDLEDKEGCIAYSRKWQKQHIHKPQIIITVCMPYKYVKFLDQTSV